MNKYEALMWCAKNVEKWGEHARCPEGWHRTWRHEYMLSGDPEFTYTTPETAVSKSEWQAAREEYLAEQRSQGGPLKPQWSGEGLPSVGWVGEFVEIKCPLSGKVHPAIEGWKSGDKLKCVAHVIISERETAVMQNMRLECVSSLRPDLYRPIRTDREKSIDAIYQDVWDSPAECPKHLVSIIGKFIDAGYGKLEK